MEIWCCGDMLVLLALCLLLWCASSHTDLSLCLDAGFLNVDFGPDFRLFKRIPLLKSKITAALNLIHEVQEDQGLT